MNKQETKELVDDLVGWVKERLEKKDYPQGNFQFGSHRKIPDCEVYLNAMLHTIVCNWENPLFYPFIEELNDFRSEMTKHQ